MIFVDSLKESNNPNLLYNTSETLNTFGIICEPLKPFAFNFLVRYKTLFAFLSGFDRGAFQLSKSSAPSSEFTVNNGCRAQPKLFGASKRNIRKPF